MKTRIIPLLLPAALLLNGCGTADPTDGTSITLAGAGTVLQDTNAYTPDRLAGIINCYSTNSKNGDCTAPASLPAPANGIAADPVGPAIAKFSNSLFGDAAPSVPPPTTSAPAAAEMIQRQNRLRAARNEIQGMLMTASANRCNEFKQRLRHQSTTTTFYLGALATGLSAAGAVFTNGTSQLLSGAGAATSGVNAEYQRDILSNLTSGVIIPGIDKQRTAVAQEIAGRRCLGITSYPLSVSLADVVRYHTACSVDVGVAAAGSAISQPHTQSLADVQAAVTAANQLAAALKGGKGNDVAQSAAPTATNSGTTNIAGGTGSSAPVGSTSDAYGATAAAAAAATADENMPLVGSSTALLECRPLDENGLLPPQPTSTAAATDQKPAKGAAPKKKGASPPAANAAPAADMMRRSGQFQAH